MTSRERLIAAGRGGEIDRKPVICWPVPCPESDAYVTEAPSHRLADTQLNLTPVVNPFGQALRAKIEVWDTLAEEPAKGAIILDGLVQKTRTEMKSALEHGADGVLYLLFGARGLHATPMEYGGHYLERDRELLSEVEGAAFNMIFVVGEDDAYLDFVSDLPAQAFGWDAKATGTSIAEMRAMRKGALASNEDDADIELRFGTDGAAAYLEAQLEEAHV